MKELIERPGTHSLKAVVEPGHGADLVSFGVDEDELLYRDGAFNMFPTPCRLAGCSYSFEGRRIVQQKHGEKVFMHGLVLDEAMKFENHGDRIESWIAIEPGRPVYDGFPFRCTFRISHALHETGLTIAYEVRNEDTCNIPFGYGIHPFWRIREGRENVAVRIPCDYCLELRDLVPTGNVIPVEGTDLDLRQTRDLGGLFTDAVFWKRNAGDTAEVVFGAMGKRMLIEASDDFAHMIVYAPEGKDFVCVENLTSCPNAPNLVTAGKGDVANMQVVGPGDVAEGWIRYTVSEI